MTKWQSTQPADKLAMIGSLFGGGSEQAPAMGGEDTVALLGSLGLRWVSGNGDNAVWQLPDGRRVTESAALDMALGSYDAAGKRLSAPTGIDTTPKPDASSAGATTKEIGGRVVQWNPTSQRYDIDLGPSGAGGGGMTAGQASEAAARNAQLQETIRVNSATIDRNGRLDALAGQQQAWLQQKEALARADKKEEVAATTANQIANLQVNRDRLGLETQVAQQNAMQAQRTLEFNIASANQQGQQRADEFNATQGLATQKLNTEAAAQKQRDLADQNEKIGVLAQDTGNRGRWASFVTATNGWGKDNTALGQGQSFIDDASVQPLEGSIGNRNAIQARSDTPYSFTPIAFNPLAMSGAQPGPLSMAGPTSATAGQPVMPAPQQAAAPNPYAAINAIAQAQAAANPNANPAGFNVAGDAQPGVGAFEHGGVAQGAFMAGDSSDGKENAEIVIPLGAGGAMIVSTRGMDPAKVKKMRSGMQKFATGGLFDQLGDSAKLSKGFLQDASKKFREGTPWAGMPGALPSPVYGSSPGFSPLLNGLLASGRALEQGVPVEYSNWLTERYKPDTIRGTTGVGRSG